MKKQYPVKFQFLLNDETYELLKFLAIRDEVAMGEILRRIIQEYSQQASCPNEDLNQQKEKSHLD